MVIPVRTRGTTEFQGKYPEEQFQFYFRQHWIRLFMPFARMILITAIIATMGYFLVELSFASGTGSRHIVIIMILLIFAIVQLEFLIHFYNHCLYMVVVTDRRIHRIKKTLFITDDQQSIDLWVIQDIVKSQHGIIQNTLRFGSLRVEAQESLLRLHFIPQVGKKYEELMHLREKARHWYIQHQSAHPSGSAPHPTT